MSSSRTYFNKRLEEEITSYTADVLTPLSYVVVFNDVGVSASAIMVVKRRKYNVVFNDVQLSVSGTLIIDSATFIVTTNQVGLQVSGSTPNYIDIIYPNINAPITVPYTSDGLLMDIYIPTGDTSTDAPFAIFCHPGTSDKDDFKMVTYCEAFAERGYHTAAINFGHEAGSGNFDANEQKVAAIYLWAAIRFLKANAATYGIDAAKGFVHGCSAGGVLAFQGILAMDNSNNSYFNSAYNIAINGENGGYSNTVLASASAPGEAGGKYTNSFLTIADVPHYSWHGDQDPVIPWENDEEAINDMIAIGIPSEFVLLADVEHGIDADLVVPTLAIKWAAFL